MEADQSGYLGAHTYTWFLVIGVHGANMKFQPVTIKFILYLTLLLILVGAVAPGVVVANDDYPEDDDCSDVQQVSDPTGTYSGVINSDSDIDSVVTTNFDEGDYLRVKFTAENSKGFEVHFDNPDNSIVRVSNTDNALEFNSGRTSAIIDNPSYEAYATFTALDSGFLCLFMFSRGGEAPFGWTVEVMKNDDFTTPTPTATPTLTPTATPTPTPTDSPETSTPSPTDDSSSGDGIEDSDGDGVIGSEDYAPNDPEVQEKSDIQETSEEDGPGFGFGVTIIGLLIATFILRRPN